MPIVPVKAVLKFAGDIRHGSTTEHVHSRSGVQKKVVDLNVKGDDGVVCLKVNANMVGEGLVHVVHSLRATTIQHRRARPAATHHNFIIAQRTPVPMDSACGSQGKMKLATKESEKRNRRARTIFVLVRVVVSMDVRRQTSVPGGLRYKEHCHRHNRQGDSAHASVLSFDLPFFLSFHFLSRETFVVGGPTFSPPPLKDVLFVDSSYPLPL